MNANGQVLASFSESLQNETWGFLTTKKIITHTSEIPVFDKVKGLVTSIIFFFLPVFFLLVFNFLENLIFFKSKMVCSTLKNGIQLSSFACRMEGKICQFLRPNFHINLFSNALALLNACLVGERSIQEFGHHAGCEGNSVHLNKTKVNNQHHLHLYVIHSNRLSKSTFFSDNFYCRKLH